MWYDGSLDGNSRIQVRWSGKWNNRVRLQWDKEEDQYRREEGTNSTKLFDKSSGNHIILYLSKIIYNTYKCMYIHTTHTHTFKEVKPHAKNMTQKNQRLGKPQYQVWATSLWNNLQDYLSESQNDRVYQQTPQLSSGDEVAPLGWKTPHWGFLTQLGWL